MFLCNLYVGFERFNKKNKNKKKLQAALDDVDWDMLRASSSDVKLPP